MPTPDLTQLPDQGVNLDSLPDQVNLGGLPDQTVNLMDLPDQVDLSALPNPRAINPMEGFYNNAVRDKPPSGAGGAFDEDWEEKFIRQHPNLYGIYGVLAEFSKIGHAKYFYGEEREKFMKLPPQLQTRRLLIDTAEEVGILAAGRILGAIGEVGGAAAQRFTPSLYKVLTKPRHVLGIKAIQKAEDSGARVMDLIGERRAGIDKATVDSEVFVRQFEQTFSKQELDAIPFIRQGIKDPNVLKQIGRDDLIPIVKNPSEDLLQATKKIGNYYDEAHQFLKENWGDINYVEDYVTQLWDIPKNRRKEVLNYFVTNNPFTKKRTIPSLEEGVKLGLTPKTTNIAELLRIYDRYKIKTVHNLNFAKSITKLKDENGAPLMLRADKAPDDWITLDEPALRRAMMIGKTTTRVGETPILMKVPVKVNPEIAKELKIIFDKPFSHGAIRAIDTINAFTKKGMLSVSFFHHFALTESAFSTGIGKEAMKLWNPYKMYRALKRGDYEIFKRVPLTKDALDHGVTFGALEDVQRNRVAHALETLEWHTRNIPVLRKGTLGIRKANELWDKALWDYYHNALKLYAYEKNVSDGLKVAEKLSQKRFNRGLTRDEISEVKKEMGRFVNDSFGGQNWELNKVLGDPKARQMLHWALLAPDWTFSVLKQALAPAKGMGKTVLGDQLAGRPLTKQAVSFWARAALYFNIMAQGINHHNTKKEYGEGRFTWDNAPGHKLNVFMGRNDDGTERYLRMGKQFREVLEWGQDPIKKFGAKLSPTTREGIRQVSAHDPGSGYPTEWEEKGFFESIPERLKSIGEMPLPFSLRPYVKSRPHVFMFTFPTSKGMTNYKTVKLFKQAIKDTDSQQIKRIYIAALENNLDAEQLFASAKAFTKADITYDDKKIAKEIFHETRRLNPQAQEDALRVYKDRGILTPNVLRKYIQFVEKWQKVQKHKQLLGRRSK